MEKKRENIGVILAVAALVVALLNWLFPFNPVRSSPISGSSDSTSTASVVAAINLPASAGWLETSLSIKDGQALLISAQGVVNINNGNQVSNTTPNGFVWNGINCDRNYTENILGEYFAIDCPMPGVAWGALVGRIGDNAPFFIGTTYQFISTASGKLYLAVNDCCRLSDNTGEFTVTIFFP